RALRICAVTVATLPEVTIRSLSFRSSEAVGEVPPARVSEPMRLVPALPPLLAMVTVPALIDRPAARTFRAVQFPAPALVNATFGKVVIVVPEVSRFDAAGVTVTVVSLQI